MGSSVFANSYNGGRDFHAGISVLKYDTHESGDSIASSDDARTYLDVKLGYLSQEMYFGAECSLLNRTVNANDQKRTSWGAVLGYHSDGFFADLIYYPSSEFSYSSAVALKEGTGFGADLGYNTLLTFNFYVGVELSYKSLSYKQQDPALAVSNKFSEFYPALGLGFYF